MPFTLNVTLPFDHLEPAGEFTTMAAVHDVAHAAEEAGFYGVNVTDHPCPSAKWLDNGGHYAQDPFVTLSLVAAVTSRVKLQTGILVLPYRNPFVTARMVASLDAFSGGRVILGMGAGYLKGEYHALGADFDQRNVLFDEYILAMKAAWTGEDFDFEGTGYSARGCRMRPAPVQRPHPPLLVGGNSRRAIRRAVELADAWNPFHTSAALTNTARTAAMEGEDDLLAGIAYMHEHCERIGRATPPAVITGSLATLQGAWSAQEVLDKIEAYEKIGVTGTAVNLLARDRTEWCDMARRAGEEIVDCLG